MPELPEVETIRRGLTERLIGASIKHIDVRSSKSVSGDPSMLSGKKITEVRRHGKLLVFVLDSGEAFTVHLKMTGQLLWKGDKDPVMGGHPASSYMEKLPHKHTRVVMEFSDGSVLYFNDLRLFGRLAVLTEEALAEHPFVSALGPEPLEKEFSLAYLQKQLVRKKSSNLKAFLLDQTNIAGLGNIYADESLWRARLLPTRKAGELSASQIKDLYESIKETLELAIHYGGSSEKDYVNAIGEKGTYLKVANVYHRTHLPCTRNDGGEIRRIKLAGRSTHYCPVCQV